MELTVLNSGSLSNGYVLQDSDSALVIETGTNIQECLKALSFNTAKVCGCILSHEHGDHSKYIEKYLQYMQVYCSRGTREGIKFRSKRRPEVVEALKTFKIGKFTVMPFPVQHDSNEPFGYLIKWGDNLVLFATDTYYLKYRFEGLTGVMIECNYDKETLKHCVDSGITNKIVMRRTLRSHMSLDTCIDTLKANDLSRVNNIVLLHVSQNNLNKEAAVKAVENAIYKRVYVAKKGLKLNFNVTPF